MICSHSATLTHLFSESLLSLASFLYHLTILMTFKLNVILLYNVECRVIFWVSHKVCVVYILYIKFAFNLFRFIYDEFLCQFLFFFRSLKFAIGLVTNVFVTREIWANAKRKRICSLQRRRPVHHHFRCIHRHRELQHQSCHPDKIQWAMA